MALGVDLHPYYQRNINWQQLAGAVINGSTVDYGWVKLSDGGAAYRQVVNGVTYVPDTMVNGLRSIGRKVGGYHYAQLSPSPEAQADLFTGQVRRLGVTDLVPMLDLEAPFTPTNPVQAKNFGVAFCNRVAAAGFTPGVYLSASMAQATRPDQWGIPGLVIWVARYGAKPEAPGAGQYIGRYDVHQYSSSQSIAGVTCDMDWSYTNNYITGSQGDDMTPDEHDALVWCTQALRSIDRELLGNLNGDPSFNANLEFTGPLSGFPSLVDGSMHTPAAYLQFIDRATYDANQKLGALTDLIAKQHDVSADDIAAALRAGLVSDLLPVLQQVVTQALGSDNAEQAQQIAAQVITDLGQKLAPPAAA